MKAVRFVRKGLFVNIAAGLLIVLVCSLQAMAAVSAESEARAVWVTRWDYKTEDDVVEIIKNAASCNFNMVLFQVRGNGNAFYPSDYEAWAEELGGADPGFDPLAVAIEEAHRRGIELHAYVNVYPAWKGTELPKAPTQIFNLHPEWICMGKSGRRIGLNDHYVYLSPGIPDAKDHIYNVFMDIVSRYPIDGLHLDYVRYPERNLNGFVDDYSYDAIPVVSSPGDPRWFAGLLLVGALVALIVLGKRSRPVVLGRWRGSSSSCLPIICCFRRERSWPNASPTFPPWAPVYSRGIWVRGFFRAEGQAAGRAGARGYRLRSPR